MERSPAQAFALRPRSFALITAPAAWTAWTTAACISLINTRGLETSQSHIEAQHARSYHHAIQFFHQSLERLMQVYASKWRSLVRGGRSTPQLLILAKARFDPHF